MTQLSANLHQGPAFYQLIVGRYETAVSLQDRIVARDREFGISTKGADELLEQLIAALAHARQTLVMAGEHNRTK